MWKFSYATLCNVPRQRTVRNWLMGEIWTSVVWLRHQNEKKPNTYILHVPKTSQDQRSSSIPVIGELSVTYAWLTDKWRRWHLLALTHTIASVGRSWRHLTCARPLHRRHPYTQSQSNDWFNQSVNQWEHTSNPPRFTRHTRRHYSMRIENDTRVFLVCIKVWKSQQIWRHRAPTSTDGTQLFELKRKLEIVSLHSAYTMISTALADTIDREHQPRVHLSW